MSCFEQVKDRRRNICRNVVVRSANQRSIAERSTTIVAAPIRRCKKRRRRAAASWQASAANLPVCRATKNARPANRPRVAGEYLLGFGLVSRNSRSRRRLRKFANLNGCCLVPQRIARHRSSTGLRIAGFLRPFQLFRLVGGDGQHSWSRRSRFDRRDFRHKRARSRRGRDFFRHGRAAASGRRVGRGPLTRRTFVLRGQGSRYRLRDFRVIVEWIGNRRTTAATIAAVAAAERLTRRTSQTASAAARTSTARRLVIGPVVVARITTPAAREKAGHRRPNTAHHLHHAAADGRQDARTAAVAAAAGSSGTTRRRGTRRRGAGWRRAGAARAAGMVMVHQDTRIPVRQGSRLRASGDLADSGEDGDRRQHFCSTHVRFPIPGPTGDWFPRAPVFPPTARRDAITIATFPTSDRTDTTRTRRTFVSRRTSRATVKLPPRRKRYPVSLACGARGSRASSFP